MTLAKTLTQTAALGAVLLALAACGRVGSLDQPAPLYGDKAKADYQARKAAAAAAAAADGDNDKPEPLAPDTPGLDPPASGVDTLRARPVPGAPALPNGAPPPGVLPDPITRPQ